MEHTAQQLTISIITVVPGFSGLRLGILDRSLGSVRLDLAVAGLVLNGAGVRFTLTAGGLRF